MYFIPHSKRLCASQLSFKNEQRRLDDDLVEQKMNLRPLSGDFFKCLFNVKVIAALNYIFLQYHFTQSRSSRLRSRSVFDLIDYLVVFVKKVNISFFSPFFCQNQSSLLVFKQLVYTTQKNNGCFLLLQIVIKCLSTNCKHLIYT